MHLHKMQPSTIIKTPTSLNTAVPSSGDYETNLYLPNTPQFMYYTTHIEMLKILK
jgi:hypothetical protein